MNSFLQCNPSGSRRRHFKALAGLMVANGLLLTVAQVAAVGYWNGQQIMQEVYHRHHEFPFVYEEHSLVIVDKEGQRDTRQARRYSRIEENGEMKLLYVFETPPEVKGVTMFAQRDTQGKTTSTIYLPALGAKFLESTGTGSGGNLIGTDFAMADLTDENLDEYEYERVEDEKIGAVEYFVIDVYTLPDQSDLRQRLRRHYVQRDNYFITRTDHFDRQGLLNKRQSFHDLKKIDEDMWRADTILMDEKKQKHRSLIKISRRVFSEDYVPASMFSKEWILASYPPLDPAAAASTSTTEADPAGEDVPDENNQTTEPVTP